MFPLEILKSILFGIVEGITEWLPVSSTGHLILLGELLRFDASDAFYELFDVVIQLGAICAVIVIYRQRLVPLHKSVGERRQTYRLWWLTLLGVLPSAVAGLFFDDLLDAYFYNPLTVAVMLVAYGVAFIAVERAKRGSEPSFSDISELTPKRALLVGLFQVLSLIPGTSRSGATILGAYLCGASRPLAAEFSFFLAIPTMAGAGALKAAKFFFEGNVLSLTEIAILLVGTLTAFFISLVSVRFLTELVRRHSFSGFGVYRIVLGALVLIYYFAGRL
ncbi:MAG: undecaprenyl-diphosphate phosphatase [Clostridia bacterium]|nr:undecaprenyl-diphosphate phosphatase [Clostridia bacterium]